MFHLRFNQVFVGLLALSFLSAFVLPSRLTNPLRSIQGLFYPVARPARAIGLALNRRFELPPKDDRSVSDVRAENRQLQQLVSELTAQLEDLQRVNADRKLLGDVQRLCTPAKVVGSGAGGQRESLSLRAGTLENVREGMPVLYKHGLAGRIDRAGPAGSQVQLVTDRDFGAAVQFRRYVPKPGNKIVYETPGQKPPFARGAGRGRITIGNIELKESTRAIENPIRVGDIVVLNDPEWESANGQWLGQVEKIEPNPNVQLYAIITVRPIVNLAALDEVMVMNKTPQQKAASLAPEN